MWARPVSHGLLGCPQASASHSNLIYHSVFQFHLFHLFWAETTFYLELVPKTDLPEEILNKNLLNKWTG